MSEPGPEGPPVEASQGDITAGELAEAIRVELGTVQRWCRERFLPAIKIGRTWWIDPQALERADPDVWSVYVEGVARRGIVREVLPSRRGA